MKINKINIALFAILGLTFSLRIFNLENLPASLNPDEAGLGYNAYSLLKSARDEHGVLIPTALKSFGDWKLPIYSYVATLPVFLMGLNEVSVRLPSVFAGVIAVWLIYKIGKLLYKKNEIAVIASIFYALSPWAIYFSRAAYEVNLGVTFFLGGFYFLLLILENKIKSPQTKWIAVLTALLMGCALFTYHSFLIFIPLFVFSAFLIYRKWTFDKVAIYLFLSLTAIFIIASFINSFLFGNNKMTTLFIFNDKDIIYNRVELLRGDNSVKNHFIEKVLHIKYSGGLYQIGQNYLNSFSPSFLFDKGGEKLVHNIGTFGYLYLIDAVFLVLGIGFLFRNRVSSSKLIFIWLILSPIASSMTKDTPNATRLFIMMPVFILITSYGAYSFLTFFNKPNFRLILQTLVILLYVFNVVYFLDSYFIHFNTHRARFWRYGYREAVYIANQFPNHRVVMRGPENFPYIYFLFYNKFDPIIFRKEVVYYPPTSEGFLFVKSFDRFSFVEKIDYDNLRTKTLYVDDRINPSNKIKTINLPSGEAILQYQITE